MADEHPAARIVASGVIAILRLEGAGDLLPIVEAIHEGGVTAIEFTLTTRGAIQALRPAQERLGRGALLGVGTVLTAEIAHEAILAGAEFVVTPTLNPAVVHTCRDLRVPVISGAFSPTEIVQAWDLGATLVKVFPAGVVGPRYIQDLRGPLPQIPLVPTGGISLENVEAFIQAGAAAVGVGGSMVPKESLVGAKFGEITKRAREFVDAVARARAASSGPIPPG